MSDPICENCGHSVLECQGFCQKKLKEFYLDLDELSKEIFQELERIQDGIHSHTVMFLGKNKSHTVMFLGKNKEDTARQITYKLCEFIKIRLKEEE